MAVSVVHEERRVALDTMLVLTGCTHHVPLLPDGVVPDVARFRPVDRLLVLGDAKHSESPGCMATQNRLRTYAKWLRAAHASGDPVALAVIHGPDARWADTLEAVLESVGLEPSYTRLAELTSIDLVTLAVVRRGPTDEVKADCLDEGDGPM